MEVRIDCSCGTPYAFEVEPVDGQMPTTVQCPTCGVDGTEAANQYLAQVLGSVSPAAVAPRPAAALAGGTQAAHPPARKGRTYGEPNLALGSLGAVAAAIIAMGVWYLIIKATNTEFGIIAWGVGIVIGVACRTLGGGYSQKLGIIAGASALVAIVGGEYAATRSAFNGFVNEFVGSAYESQMTQARRGIEAAKDDNELRAFLAEDASEEGNVTEPSEIAASDVQEFRRERLPKLEAFAAGSPSKQEFEDTLRREMNSAEMQALVFRESFSLWTLLWLFLGVGSAYKLGTGQTE